MSSGGIGDNQRDFRKCVYLSNYRRQHWTMVADRQEGLLMTRSRNMLWGAIAAIMATAFLPVSASAQDKPLTKVVMSLDFIPLGRHAPWYAALAEGYFKDEGLDVSIIP